MNKYQKNKITGKQPHSIIALHHQLFDKLQAIDQHNTDIKGDDQLFQQFQQYSNPYSHQILHKAKKVAYSNKGKIEKMRNQIKKMEEGESADFVTGVGLYHQQQEQKEFYPDIDEGVLMKNLRDTKFDDLSELRRMIKRTENNLKQYSQSMYNTQNQIVNMADKFGREIDVGLSIKINRCGLEKTHHKPSKLKIGSPVTDIMKRRTMSSFNAQRNRI